MTNKTVELQIKRIIEKVKSKEQNNSRIPEIKDDILCVNKLMYTLLNISQNLYSLSTVETKLKEHKLNF